MRCNTASVWTENDWMKLRSHWTDEESSALGSDRHEISSAGEAMGHGGMLNDMGFPTTKQF